ncbi:MAG: Gfo/Idh/MocA family oxidoreductase [Planctomycetaceae bacterium]|nr:Gfo/Idh/MocA family oxidoreductase [Planctomycetaceae bacterium]
MAKDSLLPEHSTHRRDFLKMTAGVAVPWILPSSVFGAFAPSNRINVACIGTGNQGSGILKRFLENDDVQVVAVCDVNTASYGYRDESQYLGREPGRKTVDDHYAKKSGTAYKGCRTYIDFQEVLACDDVDAVTVVVPDQWHAIMTIAAAKAGKDIYCEKPLSLTIGQGRAMVEAVKKYDRILQTGSMERSNPLNRYVCKLVRDGKIGQVKRVFTNVGYNNKVGPGPGWKPMPVPEGFDYERWLGPAPKVPYHQDRCLYRFRFNYDYSGGQVTNYGAHSNDLAQWGLGMDESGPVEIEYIRAKWLPEGSLFNTALETEFLCRYANGVELICATNEKPVGVRFEGTEGMVESTAYGWQARSEPASLVESEFPGGKVKGDATSAHVRNFLDCVKSRQQPVAHAEIGHRSSSVCHLGNVAIRLGRNVKWDPVAERFPGDDEANEMLLRPMRGPWVL